MYPLRKIEHSVGELVSDDKVENISQKIKFTFRDMDDETIMSMHIDDALLDYDDDMGAEAEPQPPTPQSSPGAGGPH